MIKSCQRYKSVVIRARHAAPDCGARVCGCWRWGWWWSGGGVQLPWAAHRQGCREWLGWGKLGVTSHRFGSLRSRPLLIRSARHLHASGSFKASRHSALRSSRRLYICNIVVAAAPRLCSSRLRSRSLRGRPANHNRSSHAVVQANIANNRTSLLSTRLPGTDNSAPYFVRPAWRRDHV